MLKSNLSPDGEVSLDVDFYGETDEQDEIRNKRVKLV